MESKLNQAFNFPAVELDLSSNQLNGNLPDAIWGLTNLQRLLLDFNQFSGALSPNAGTLSLLRYLSVEQSGFSGPIPPSLGSLTLLESASLQWNQLTGPMPDALCNVPSLKTLQADCDRGGKVQCRCCTLCCSQPGRPCRVPKGLRS